MSQHNLVTAEVWASWVWFMSFVCFLCNWFMENGSWGTRTLQVHMDKLAPYLSSTDSREHQPLQWIFWSWTVIDDISQVHRNTATDKNTGGEYKGSGLDTQVWSDFDANINPCHSGETSVSSATEESLSAPWDIHITLLIPQHNWLLCQHPW